jgi:hypothetical protein
MIGTFQPISSYQDIGNVEFCHKNFLQTGIGGFDVLQRKSDIDYKTV